GPASSSVVPILRICWYERDVAGLDIPVEHACGVNRPDGFTEVDTDQGRFSWPKWSLRGQQRRQSLAADKVAPESDPAVMTVDSVHRHHVGMANLSNGASFAKGIGYFTVGIATCSRSLSAT